MSHKGEHHHHGVERLTTLKSGYYISIALTLGFVAVEVIAGIAGNSISLLSDAGHRFADSISLIMSLVAFKLSTSKSTSVYTYGFKKASVLIAFINALLLFFVVVSIIVESSKALADPSEVNGESMTLFAAIGIAVGALSALVLMKHRGHDINTRGAFLHLATDALVSVGVLVSGVIITYTGWNMLDPLVSIVIAAVLLSNTVVLIRDSFRMIMDGVPVNLRIAEITNVIGQCENVESVQDVHVRAISVTENALTARVAFRDLAKADSSIAEIKKNLSEMNITEVVIEVLFQ